MNFRYAVVTSPEEVERYFTGRRWSPLSGPSKFERNIQDEYYNIRLSPGEETFDVTIEAIDDPSDSSHTEDPTTDPVSFISKFLRQDDVGDLSRVSFDPSHLARRLRQVSSAGPRSIERVLRRAIIMIAEKPIVRVAADGDLASEVKKKGWTIEDESDRETVVNISDVYRATIRPMGVEWEYQFEVRGVDSATVHGTTQDPIIKYREWYKKDATIEAIQSVDKERTDKKKTEDEARDNQETVAPVRKKKPSIEDADTEKP